MTSEQQAYEQARALLSAGAHNENTGDDRHDALTARVGGPMTTTLCKLWGLDQRQRWGRFVHSGNAASNQVLGGVALDSQKKLRAATKTMMQQVHDAMPYLHDSFRARLACSVLAAEGDEDDDAMVSHQRVRFYKVLQAGESREQYALLMAKVLRVLHQLGGLNLAQQTALGLRFPPAIRHRLSAFNGVPLEGNNLAGTCFDMIIDLLRTSDATMCGSYSTDPLCAIIAGSLINTNTNGYECGASAQKTISAIKFYCRGAIMLKGKALVEGDGDNLRARVDALYSLATINPCNTNTMSSLTLMSKAVGCFDKNTVARVWYGTAQGSVLIDGKEAGAPMLQPLIKKLVAKTKAKLSMLLMGCFSVGDLAALLPHLFAAGDPSRGASMNEKNSGLGLPAEEVAWCKLMTKVLQKKKLRVKFFDESKYQQGDFAVKVSKNSANDGIGTTRFLQLCREMEEAALVLVHVLSGCCNRATNEYEAMTYRNPSSDYSTRSLRLQDKHFALLEGFTSKTALLQTCAGSGVKSTMLPIKELRWFFSYLVLVRPMGQLLRLKVLERKGVAASEKSKVELARWHTHLFVKASGNRVRDLVRKRLPDGLTFQDLRHAGEALFREHVVPREYRLQDEYPHEHLFGHSKATAVSYGQQAVFGGRKAIGRSEAINITALRRMYVRYWEVVTGEESRLDDDGGDSSNDDGGSDESDSDSSSSSNSSDDDSGSDAEENDDGVNEEEEEEEEEKEEEASRTPTADARTTTTATTTAAATAGEPSGVRR